MTRAPTSLFFKVSDLDGTVASFATATEQTYEFDGGASYTQIHRIEHLSDATQDTFWVFTRVTSATWRLLPLSVDQATGAITFGTDVTLLTAGGQTYISTADAHSAGDQTIRFAWGYNPASGLHAIRY